MKFNAVIIMAICLTSVCGSSIIESQHSPTVSGSNITEKKHTPAENPRATCGFNGKMFKYIYDKCMLINDNCRMKDRAPWIEVPMWLCLHEFDLDIQEKCGNLRPEDYDFVCAIRGKTFQFFLSRYFFQIENCLTNNKWNESELAICSSKNLNNHRFISLGSDSVINPSDVMGRVCGINDDSVMFFDDECAMHYNSCIYDKDWIRTNTTLCYDAL